MIERRGRHVLDQTCIAVDGACTACSHFDNLLIMLQTWGLKVLIPDGSNYLGCLLSDIHCIRCRMHSLLTF